MGRSHGRGGLAARGVAVAVTTLFAVACSEGGGVVGPGAEEPPPASLAELLGPTLVRADGTAADVNVVAARTLVGLYFAAAWCPACGSFTPLLVKTYEELRQGGKSFEVVFVSLDNGAAEMFDHMRARGMPWLALPHSRAKAETLAQRFAVAWIPSLVILDSRGAVVTTAGREGVAGKGAAAYDDWVAAAGK